MWDGETEEKRWICHIMETTFRIAKEQPTGKMSHYFGWIRLKMVWQSPQSGSVFDHIGHCIGWLLLGDAKSDFHDAANPPLFLTVSIPHLLKIIFI